MAVNNKTLLDPLARRLLGGGCAHAGQQVLVGVHGEPGVGVAEPFRHHV